MKEQLFSQYALYWAGGFLLIYVLMQLLVLKHSRFQAFSPMQKSLMVKVLALIVFAAAYIFVTFLVG